MKQNINTQIEFTTMKRPNYTSLMYGITHPEPDRWFICSIISNRLTAALEGVSCLFYPVMLNTGPLHANLGLSSPLLVFSS